LLGARYDRPDSAAEGLIVACVSVPLKSIDLVDQKNRAGLPQRERPPWARAGHRHRRHVSPPIAK
jgi:hypothetical protein